MSGEVVRVTHQDNSGCGMEIVAAPDFGTRVAHVLDTIFGSELVVAPPLNQVLEVASSVSGVDEFSDELRLSIREWDKKRRDRILLFEEADDLESTIIRLESAEFLEWVYGRKLIFGHSITELVKMGADVIERSYHETADSRVALGHARKIQSALETECNMCGAQTPLVNNNTGLGTMLFAMRAMGLNVIATVEENATILSYSQKLWDLLGLSNSKTFEEVEIVCGNAETVFNTILQNKGYSPEQVVSENDPPWSRHYNNGGSTEFTDMKPNVWRVLEAYPKSIVILKVGPNFGAMEADLLSERMNRSVLVYKQRYNLEGRPNQVEGVVILLPNTDQRVTLLDVRDASYFIKLEDEI